MVKKKYRTYEDFETQGNSNYVALYWDMLDSKAWLALTPHDIKLYLYMRRKYYRKVSTVNGGIISSNKDDISVTEKEIRGNKLLAVNTFWKSIDNLIDKGFIIVKRNGYATRECNIYEFVDMWKRYPVYKPRLENMRNPLKSILKENVSNI